MKTQFAQDWEDVKNDWLDLAHYERKAKKVNDDAERRAAEESTARPFKRRCSKQICDASCPVTDSSLKLLVGSNQESITEEEYMGFRKMKPWRQHEADWKKDATAFESEPKPTRPNANCQAWWSDSWGPMIHPEVLRAQGP